jgi:hypothetical protein
MTLKSYFGTQHKQLHKQVGQNRWLLTFIPISRECQADKVMAADVTHTITLCSKNILTNFWTVERN